MYRSLIAAAVLFGAVSTPALAATDTFKMDVEFTRENLATAKGASAEYRDIREQVADRCESEHAEMSFGKDFAIKACTERTLSRTIRKIDNPNLTAVHAARR